MFFSRQDAGKKLALRFKEKNLTADLVLGIPRGGVIVAKEVADNLKIPLNALVVKKIGAPFNPELAIGAVTADGICYIDERLAQSVSADSKYIKNEIRQKRRQAKERERLLHSSLKEGDIADKGIIIVDDGVATGATLLAAINWLKQKQARKIILGLPVAPKATGELLCQLVDECIIMDEPLEFGAVGQFYQNFNEVSDREAASILQLQKTNSI